MSIKYIKVVGIFDRQDIEFDFLKSPFFIVGPNGTGKSTSLKILHYILTAQWTRLDDLPFYGIEAEINNNFISVERSDLAKIERMKTLLFRSMRRPIGRRIVSSLPAKWDVAKDFLSRDFPGPQGSGRKLSQALIDQLESNYESISLLSNYVERETKGRVLYFPTYRRIERDLHELLEAGAEEDDIPFEDQPSIAPKVAARFKEAGEVIGFGGQDIRALLKKISSTIEIEARRTLSEHSVRFLEALSKDRTDLTKQARNLVLSENRTNRLLDRVAASTSSNIDIDAIKNSISALRSKISKAKPGRLTQQQEMLLFYVGELLKANDKIDSLAAPLAQFSRLATKYLAPVKTSYLRETDNHVVILDRSDNEIELDQLSSGEKQILAFFAFLTLENNVKPKYIMIDEPELSLSVSWQKSLIKDIMEVSGASYVLSATHSPFIFENFSLDNVISLGTL